MPSSPSKGPDAEEIVAEYTRGRAKRRPLTAELPRTTIEIIPP